MDKQNKTKKIITGVVAVFILFLIIGAIGSGSKKDDEEKKEDHVSVQEEQKDDSAEQDAQIAKINDYLQNDFLKRAEHGIMYNYDNPDEPKYNEYNHKFSLIKGFRKCGDDICAIVYYSNMKAEGWDTEDFITPVRGVLTAYVQDTGDKLHYHNFDSDGDLIEQARNFKEYYIEVE